MISCIILFLHFSLLKAFLKFVLLYANFRFKWFPASRLMIWIRLWAAHFFILLCLVSLTYFFTCVASVTLKNLTVQIYEKFNAKMILSYFYRVYKQSTKSNFADILRKIGQQSKVRIFSWSLMMHNLFWIIIRAIHKLHLQGGQKGGTPLWYENMAVF